MRQPLEQQDGEGRRRGIRRARTLLSRWSVLLVLSSVLLLLLGSLPCVGGSLAALGDAPLPPKKGDSHGQRAVEDAGLRRQALAEATPEEEEDGDGAATAAADVAAEAQQQAPPVEEAAVTEEAPEEADALVAEAQAELTRDAELVNAVAGDFDRLQVLYKRVFDGEDNAVGIAGAPAAPAQDPVFRAPQQQNHQQQQEDRAALKAEIARIQESLATLLGSLDETQRDLTQAHEAMAQEKVLEGLEAMVREGKVTTDYETGELNAPGALGNLTASLAVVAAAKAEDRAAEEAAQAKQEAKAEGDGNGGGARREMKKQQQQQQEEGGGAAASGSSKAGAGGGGAAGAVSGAAASPSREQEVAAVVEKLQAAADPARLHLDVGLLRDVVLMSVATALGGFAATVARLPPATGFMAAGMLIGPSGLNLVQNLVQLETLAQFGSIFLLFGHGLMYCQHYGSSLLSGTGGTGGLLLSSSGSGPDVASSSSAATAAGAAATAAVTAAVSSLSDTFVAGILILCAIFLIILAFTFFVGSGHLYQATLVASAVALSSTTTTAHALAANRLRETAYGKALIELMAVQDLLMAPLLSIPTAVKDLLYEHGAYMMLPILCLYGSALAAVALLSKRLIPKIINLRNRGEQSLSLDLFILGIVSYCLLMSLLTEWMGLSHEAGALLAGLILADVPNLKAVAVIEPLTCLFGGMYLGSLGMLLSPVFLVNHAGLIVGCVLAVLAIKVFAVAAGMRSLGFSRKAALLGGLSLAQISELSLFLVARAHEYRLITRRTYLIVVATTVVLLMLTPISAHLFRHLDRAEYLGAAKHGSGGGQRSTALDNGLKGSSGDDKDFDAADRQVVDGGGEGKGKGRYNARGKKTPVHAGGKSVTHRGKGGGGGWWGAAGGKRDSGENEALLVEMA